MIFNLYLNQGLIFERIKNHGNCVPPNNKEKTFKVANRI